MDYTDFHEHKDKITERFVERWQEKYDRGQEEHGGRLWRKQCLPMLLDEVLDFVSYASVIEDQIDEMKRIARLGLASSNAVDAEEALKYILNILEVGNTEGTTEEDH